MKPTGSTPLQLLLPTMLLLLISACATDSSRLVVPPAPRPPLPPLPIQAHQPIPPLLCRGGCSSGLTTLRDSLQPTPTSSEAPWTPASAPIRR